MEYQIVVVLNKNEGVACDILARRVNDSFISGWKPQGGISITRTYDELCFVCQAMIKESKEEKN